MTSAIEIKQVTNPTPLLVVRRRANRSELSRVVPEACGTVWNAVKANKMAGAGRNVAVYLDNVFNIEVGLEFEKVPSDVGELFVSALPAGKVAHATHMGPYQTLGQTHDAIQAWCNHNGHAFSICWELYGHWKPEWNNDATQIRTDVFYLLK